MNGGRWTELSVGDVCCDFPRVGVLDPQKEEGSEPAIACYKLSRPPWPPFWVRADDAAHRTMASFESNGATIDYSSCCGAPVAMAAVRRVPVDFGPRYEMPPCEGLQSSSQISTPVPGVR